TCSQATFALSIPSSCFSQICATRGTSSRSVVYPTSGGTPGLHSFPTRRSSDLTATTAAITRSRPFLLLATALTLSAFAMYAVVRSEEHTSELQSRENLVCRLLLEKTKMTNQYVATTAIARTAWTEIRHGMIMRV